MVHGRMFITIDLQSTNQLLSQQFLMLVPLLEATNFIIGSPLPLVLLIGL